MASTPMSFYGKPRMRVNDDPIDDTGSLKALNPSSSSQWGSRASSNCSTQTAATTASLQTTTKTKGKDVRVQPTLSTASEMPSNSFFQDPLVKARPSVKASARKSASSSFFSSEWQPPASVQTTKNSQSPDATRQSQCSARASDGGTGEQSKLRSAPTPQQLLNPAWGAPTPPDVSHEVVPNQQASCSLVPALDPMKVGTHSWVTSLQAEPSHHSCCATTNFVWLLPLPSSSTFAKSEETSIPNLERLIRVFERNLCLRERVEKRCTVEQGRLAAPKLTFTRRPAAKVHRVTREKLPRDRSVFFSCHFTNATVSFPLTSRETTLTLNSAMKVARQHLMLRYGHFLAEDAFKCAVNRSLLTEGQTLTLSGFGADVSLFFGETLRFHSFLKRAWTVEGTSSTCRIHLQLLQRRRAGSFSFMGHAMLLDGGAAALLEGLGV